MTKFSSESNLDFKPLADRVRPKSFNHFVGQENIVGKDKILRQAIEKDQLFSMIFWGPPGSGKTTLAQIIAQITNSYFVQFSAVTSGVSDIKKVVEEARERLRAYVQKTILFVDEIHRFNKAQQDAFLPHVESGTIILIGATTENPSFEVIGPLLSRCRVFVLEGLNTRDITRILTRAIRDKNGLKDKKVKISPKMLQFIAESSNGDARIGLNVLEIAANLANGKIINQKMIEEALQQRPLLYDKKADEHYNTISAYIKSMRASDVNAALYYLARMVEAGEDPLFIARRMVVFASEDIGMALPTALVVANEVFRACETIGFPECQENLAVGTVYLALAPKDRSAYDAYMTALSDVKTYQNLPIPLEVRNAPTKLMKELGYGQSYEKYPQNRSFLPDKLKGKKYFTKKVK